MEELKILKEISSKKEKEGKNIFYWVKWREPAKTFI